MKLDINLGGIGAMAAAILSFLKWHSIGWAIVHALLGWFYVVYYVLAFGLPHIPVAK